MTQVNINPEPPSQAIIKAANATITVTDSQGRKITVRRLKTLDRMRLFELVGADNAKNEQYFGYAALAYSVTEIDGVPVATLTSKMQLEALVQRLDDHGFAAVAQGIAENFSISAGTEQDAKDAVKNG